MLLLLHLTTASAQPAGDLRGPGRNGTYPDARVPERFDADGPELLWQRDGIGQGWMGPTIAGDRIYTLGSKAGTVVLSCYSLQGERLYQVECGPSFQRRYPGCRSGVVVAEGRVYFSTARGVVHCRDAKTGQAVWSVDTIERWGHKPSNWGWNPTPLVADGKVVFSMTGARAQTVALDAATGKLVWQGPPKGWTVSDASPIAVRLGGRTIVVETFHQATVARDLSDGSACWMHMPGGHTQLTPVHGDGHLLLRQGGSMSLLKLAEDGGSVRLLWSAPRMNDPSQAVIVADTVFSISQPIWRSGEFRSQRGGPELVLKGRRRVWLCQARDLATGRVMQAMQVYSDGSVWSAGGKVFVLEGGQGAGPDGRRGRTRIWMLQPKQAGFTVAGVFHPVPGERQVWAAGAHRGGIMAWRHGRTLSVYRLVGQGDRPADPQ
ncbi:MAG: PQQ-binding-like beta-propeller repeat protein [Phycisphaerae bacterium]